jgi:hypothetical protein
MKTKTAFRCPFIAAICAGATVLFAATIHAQAQYSYTTLSAPGAEYTYAYGISGDNVVGYYETASGGYGGFLYNISSSTYTTLNAPGEQDTYAYAISGDNVVGYYFDQQYGLEGFIYNINTGEYNGIYANGQPSGGFIPYGISGNSMVGKYNEGGVSGTEGEYLYNNLGNYTLLAVPGAQNTIAYGIDGNNIVGQSDVGSFLYSGGVYTILPLIDGDSPEVNGISGNNIAGYYYSGSVFSQVALGLVYNINSGSYSTFSVPGASDTFGEGIDGSNVVGYYQNSSGTYGFFATPVPEPSVLGLLVVGATALKLRGKIKLRWQRA